MKSLAKPYAVILLAPAFVIAGFSFSFHSYAVAIVSSLIYYFTIGFPIAYSLFDHLCMAKAKAKEEG